MNKFSVSGCLLLGILASGCTPDVGGDDYEVSSVGAMSAVYSGTIKGIRTVKIATKDRAKQGGVNDGGVIGAAGGAVAGGAMTKGAGGMLAGAAIGGTAGYFADKWIGSQKGLNYTILLDDGRTVSVTQGEKPKMQTGQRVNVIQDPKRTRVVPA